MVRLFMTAIIALAVGGCGFTPQGAAFREAVIKKGSDVAVTGLNNAERLICRMAPIGVVQDRYGISEDRAEEWRNFCPRTSKGKIIGPQASPARSSAPD